MPLPGCERCGGLGMLIEYRLTWKRPGGDRNGPVQCALGVEDEIDGWRRAAELDEDAFDVSVLSGAKDCVCRRPPPEERRGLSVELDYKMRQAGDR